MQRPNFRIVVASAVLLLLFAASAVAASHEDRYGRTLAEFAALVPAEQQTWLRNLLVERSEPAARVTLDDAAYERLVNEHHHLLDRVDGGKRLTTDELLGLLKKVDRQETEAIAKLSNQYRAVTHQAVGTNLWEYQQRVQLEQAIEALCRQSVDPFAGQPKLIAWLEAAILQQKLTDRPPLPVTPDFNTTQNTQPSAGDDTPEVLTSLGALQREQTAAEIAPSIARYNAAMAAVAARLYARGTLPVNELNTIVDEIARLSLSRIRLASNVLNLPADERDDVGQIETADTVITLARVKVSAARRQILRQAGDATTDSQFRELEGLNRVAQRLDTLATGPDR